MYRTAFVSGSPKSEIKVDVANGFLGVFSVALGSAFGFCFCFLEWVLRFPRPRHKSDREIIVINIKLWDLTQI